jgi:hypothetical protein
MALKPPICSYGPDFPGANKQIEEISVTKRKYRHRRSVDVRINCKRDFQFLHLDEV